MNAIVRVCERASAPPIGWEERSGTAYHSTNQPPLTHRTVDVVIYDTLQLDRSSSTSHFFMQGVTRHRAFSPPVNPTLSLWQSLLRFYLVTFKTIFSRTSGDGYS